MHRVLTVIPLRSCRIAFGRVLVKGHQTEAQPVPGRMCVTFAFWVLVGGGGIAFWSHGKPLCSYKWPPKEAQPASRMVCVAATRREEWGMVCGVWFVRWWVGLAFRKGNIQEKVFCDVLHFCLMTI